MNDERERTNSSTVVVQYLISFVVGCGTKSFLFLFLWPSCRHSLSTVVPWYHTARQ